MSDGNTTTPAGQPALLVPSEEQMRSVIDYVQRMKDAIVEGTKLAEEFHSLQGEVAALRKDMEFFRVRNGILDEHLQHARAQRDEAQADARLLQSKLAGVEEELAHERTISSDLAAARVYAEGKVNDLSRQRDDAEFRALQLEEELASLKGKWEALTALVCPPQAAKPSPLAPAETLIIPEGSGQSPTGPDPEPFPSGPAYIG
jgi:chromosome segregation ATPase